VTVGGTPAFTTPVNFNIFDDAAHTVLSDTLSIFVNATNDIEIDFFSGVGVTLLGGNPTAVTETGGIQDVFTISFTNRDITPLDVEFQSDEAVPEPSSLLLLVAPVLGLALQRRSAGRRHRYSVQPAV
jgi:hypothetical protein